MSEFEDLLNLEPGDVFVTRHYSDDRACTFFVLERTEHLNEQTTYFCSKFVVSVTDKIYKMTVELSKKPENYRDHHKIAVDVLPINDMMTTDLGFYDYEVQLKILKMSHQ